MDPISAATHFDPYHCHYTRLREQGGLSYDSTLGLWLASTAAAVAAVLAHPACRVRPAQEPVPRAIAGRPAGEVFARLMRMNDGPRHACPRAAMAPMLEDAASIDLGPWLARWRPALSAPGCAADLQRWQFRLPVALLAGLLGVAQEHCEELARRTGEFVACFSPLASAEQVQAADRAAQYLSSSMQALVEAPVHSPWLRRILAQRGALEPLDLQANLLGLLAQAHDACAGLLGNALIALLADPALRQQLASDPHALQAWLLQRQRLDPPVHNTRRFIAEDCSLLGVELRAGDCVLVLLAAANHDPALTALSDHDPARLGFSFGAGVHRCPGRGLALNLVHSLLHQLLQAPNLAQLALSWDYQPSVNGRIPRFSDLGEVGQ
ncbi:cytochrome P450 [Pseudomonas sp. NFXW11]|uniref:cytochrome P450 n=1 Tax=Pseudomonas sp. NFXW11 TaxID=2819531 RepID=UPI003CE8671D